MNFDQFNEKSKFLINESQNKAISLNNQQVLTEHFLASFFTNQDDFLKNILEYCKIKREHILDTLPQCSFEGEAYKGYTEAVAGSTPLYRFFNTQTGTHFYTAAEAEKDSIIENLPSFNVEGTAYWVDPVMG